MSLNLAAVLALFLGFAAFLVTYAWVARRRTSVKLALLGGAALLSLPSLLFAAYYLHLFPDQQWFFTLRAWQGAEWLVVFPGVAAGCVAALLPRMLLGLPLAAFLALGALPYLKPMLLPLHDADFHEQWKGNACLQSTSSTCGPASVCTILRSLGTDASEKEVARACYSYAGGTEAWYLARYARSRGHAARFEFHEDFSEHVPCPPWWECACEAWGIS